LYHKDLGICSLGLFGCFDIPCSGCGLEGEEEVSYGGEGDAVESEEYVEFDESGAIMFPPVLAWYTRPKDLDEVEDQRMLDMFGLDTGDFERWNGFGKKSKS
jgi:hypothetical protein